MPVQRGDIGGQFVRLPAGRESGAKTTVEIFQRAPQPAGEVDRLAKQGASGTLLRADYEGAARRSLPLRIVRTGTDEIVAHLASDIRAVGKSAVCDNS